MADRDVVKRLTDEGFPAGNARVVDELFADDFVDHDPPPGVPPRKDGVRMLIQAISSGHTDGRVVESWAMTGAHTGEAFGFHLAPCSPNVGLTLSRGKAL